MMLNIVLQPPAKWLVLPLSHVMWLWEGNVLLRKMWGSSKTLAQLLLFMIPTSSLFQVALSSNPHYFHSHLHHKETHKGDWVLLPSQVVLTDFILRFNLAPCSSMSSSEPRLSTDQEPHVQYHRLFSFFLDNILKYSMEIRIWKTSEHNICIIFEISFLNPLYLWKIPLDIVPYIITFKRKPQLTRSAYIKHDYFLSLFNQ